MIMIMIIINDNDNYGVCCCHPSLCWGAPNNRSLIYCQRLCSGVVLSSYIIYKSDEVVNSKLKLNYLCNATTQPLAENEQ